MAADSTDNIWLAIDKLVCIIGARTQLGPWKPPPSDDVKVTISSTWRFDNGRFDDARGIVSKANAEKLRIYHDRRRRTDEQVTVRFAEEESRRLQSVFLDVPMKYVYL